MLELYRPFYRAQQCKRILTYLALGALALISLLRVEQLQQQRQRTHLQQHWQQALQDAEHRRALTHPHPPVTRHPPSVPTLLTHLQAIIQPLPAVVWLEQLQMQPHHLLLQGAYQAAPDLLQYCRDLQRHFPGRSQQQLTLLPAQHFRLQLRSTMATSAIPPTPKIRDRLWLSHYYAWLMHELQQQHLYLHASRTTGGHTVALHFDATFLTIQHVLADLEHILGKQACTTLTVKLTDATGLLQAKVLCD